MLTTENFVHQFIPSQTVKQYIFEKHISFTDREKATIIWNSDLYLSAKLVDLYDIFAVTKDLELKKQMKERAAYDKKARDQFYDAEGGFIYAVNSPEDEMEENIIGFFKRAEAACEYGVGAGRDFTVQKYQLIDGGSEIIKSRSITSPLIEPNPELQIEEHESPGAPVAEIVFNRFGTMLSYWSAELPLEEEIKVNTLSRERFENAFVNIPNPFEEGDLVKIVGKEKSGVVQTSRAVWKKLTKKAQEKDAPYDWSDASLLIQFGEDPMDHGHINPIFLERV